MKLDCGPYTDGAYRQLVPRAPNPYNPTQHPGAPWRTEPGRSARQRCRAEVEGGRAGGDSDGEGVDTDSCYERLDVREGVITRAN